MSKLFINLLFVYVLLFHFVSNKDRFFIKYFGENWEFTLDDKTQAGAAFYQHLKNHRNMYGSQMEISSNCLKSKILLHISPDGASQKFRFGSIIVSADELRIVTKKERIPLEKFEQIGRLMHPEKFLDFIKKLKERNILLQFELVEGQTVAKKPRNLGEKKTKIQTSVQKRTIRDKPEYFWRNIGWKILKSLQSLFS